jgi:asparagine synthase (glutamine-hydrolysing)
MGSIFVAFSWSTEASLSEHIETRVIGAMQERSPGVVRRSAATGFLALCTGPDATAIATAATAVVVDGVLSADSQRDLSIRQHLVSGKRAVEQLDGQFALTTVDLVRRRVEIWRDRFGTHPIFWARMQQTLLIASEVKILLAAGVRGNVEPSVLNESLAFRWVLSERHLIAPIRQVPVSHFSLVDSASVRTERYWQIPFEPIDGRILPFPQAIEQTGHALRRSIEALVVGGRRIGVLLSGGIDSSIVASALREVAPMATAFAGELPDSNNEELRRAIAVANHLRMPLRVVKVKRPIKADLFSMVRRLEELPRNPNNFVLQQLYEAASSECDTVLTGDAAEMYFGLADSASVRRYRRKRKIATLIPSAVRKAIAEKLSAHGGERQRRLSRLLLTDTVNFAAGLDAIPYSKGLGEQATSFACYDAAARHLEHYMRQARHFDDALQRYQAETFLVTSLVRHDRLAQPHGVFPISPFLLPPMVEVAARLPRKYRFTSQSKAVLRGLCELWFPRQVSRWPKIGFDVPWRLWMEQELTAALTPEDVDELLPAGFASAARSAVDTEGLWAIATLRVLVAQFELHAAPELSEENALNYTESIFVGKPR